MIIYKLLIFIILILVLIILGLIYLIRNLFIYKKNIEKFTETNPNLLVIDAIKKIYKIDNGTKTYTYLQYFEYTGNIQEFEIPKDIQGLTIYCWGAGGGGSIHNKTLINP